MWRVLLTIISTLSISGCASMAVPVPQPNDSDSAGLVIDLKVRLSGIATYKADVVYFVRNCPPAPEGCEDHLIPSNYAKDGRVYLLNAPPGDYRAVATAFESGVFGDNSLYFAYLPNSLVNASSSRVQSGNLTYAGSYLVSASHGVCPENAEPDQLKYAEMIEPGTPKCGFFKTLIHKLANSDYIFIGGKAYSVGKQTYHYQGTAYEKQQPSDAAAGAFGAVLKDLSETGWAGKVRPQH